MSTGELPPRPGEPPMPEGIDMPDDPESPAEDANEPGDEKPVSLINILPLLLKADPEWINTQAKLVVKRCKEDEEGRKDFMDRRANQLRLFAGIVPAMGYPAEGAKAPHIAIIGKAVLHLWARIFDQVIPAKGDIVHVAPFGPDDEDRSQRVERHMNWQLRQRMPDWSSSHQISIMNWLLSGSMFRHYRWDPIERTHRIDYVPIDDIILPFTELDIHPLMKSVPRITRVLRMARWEAEAWEEGGMFSNLEEIYPKDDDAQASTTNGDTLGTPRPDNDSEVQKAVIEIQGVEPPERGDKDGKREYLEQHTRLKFPVDLKEEALRPIAGLNKPVIIIVDRKSKTPVSVTIREEPDPVDQTRFNQQQQAFQLAAQNSAQQQTAMAPGAPAPTPPKKPAPVRMQTIYNIIHYRLFPNPDGIYGLGVGYLLEGSNELANALAAEYMLGAKFENLKGGFMARGTREKRGDLSFPMGKWVETDLEPEVLSKALMPLTFTAPSEGLMRVVDKLEKNGDLAANADILSGEKGASNETAKGASMRNSNAMALVSVMTRLYLEPMKYELKMVAHGNSIQMEGSETFPFSEPSTTIPGKSNVQEVTVTPQDYVEDVHIEFTADARMSSKPERIADAKDFLQSIITGPMQQNPMLVDFAYRELFKVAESPNYIAAMGPPPQPPPPPEPLSQDSENAGFFEEKDHPVLPDDNHMGHMHTIDQLKKSPLVEKMSSTGKQMMDRHYRSHVAHFYMQMQELQKHTG